MLPTPKELLLTLYNDWKHDLEVNLAEQARLKADETSLRAVVETCERAFVALFPEPVPEPEPQPEETNGPDNGNSAPSDPPSTD